MEPVSAMPMVCATVFSCGVKGCLLQPIFTSHADSGFRIVKEMRPAAVIWRAILTLAGALSHDASAPRVAECGRVVRATQNSRSIERLRK